MEKTLRDKINALPEEPGVYVMKDISGEVIYVGKAVNLRERVRSYFGGGDSRAFVPLLDELLGDIDAILVKNEKEAFLLESELIRSHKPRFNIKLREGKKFVYLRIDERKPYPRLEVTRTVQNDGARYFGPYPLARALRETLKIVNRYFKLRTCSDHDPAIHRKRPCLLCQISHLPSPDIYEFSPVEYRRHVEDAILFLKGRKSELYESLKMKMEEEAAQLHFEQAARLRDQLLNIEKTLEPQMIELGTEIDQDVFGCSREGNWFAVYVLYVRQGRVTGGQTFRFGGQAFPENELLASFVAGYYEQGNFVPDEILIPLELDEVEGLMGILSDRKGRKVRISVPRRGKKLELLTMSARNAMEALKESAREDERKLQVLKFLKAILQLHRIPHRIEAFDISHFRGEGVVASRVVMTDGEPDKDQYRRYRITSGKPGDDYAAIQEVVFRRLRRSVEKGEPMPDLMVIDGGKGQLASARAAMKDLGVTGVDVIALAKERDFMPGAGFSSPGGEELRVASPEEPYAPSPSLPDRIFVPGRKEPLILPAGSPGILLLARLRDEAHRFAISYQRRLLRRQKLHSKLDEIPGVGQVRKSALLRHFGSFGRIMKAGIGELSAVSGVGSAAARKIHEYLHQGEEESDAQVYPG